LAAADSLARVGARLGSLPGDVGDALLAAAASADRDMKLFLFRALAVCTGDPAIELLATHLADDDPFVRSEAVRALAKLGQVGPQTAALLSDRDPAVRLTAAEAIAGAGGGDAVPDLVDFAFTFEGYHGRRTAQLLRGLDAGRASALFADVLRDPARKRTWAVAIEALAELNHAPAVPVG
jgi:HEAT repeat protein